MKLKNPRGREIWRHVQNVGEAHYFKNIETVTREINFTRDDFASIFRSRFEENQCLVRKSNDQTKLDKAETPSTLAF